MDLLGNTAAREGVMAFAPEYGVTLTTDEERDALTSEVREILGEPVRKADLYDLEQLIQAEVADELVGDVLAGNPHRARVAHGPLRSWLHRGLYGPVWQWGGRHCTLETSIGVAGHVPLSGVVSRHRTGQLVQFMQQ